MIDNTTTAMDLLAQLQAALPVPARLTSELRASLKAKNIGAPVPPDGAITALHYMGDEGGIVCKLDLGANMQFCWAHLIRDVARAHGHVPSTGHGGPAGHSPHEPCVRQPLREVPMVTVYPAAGGPCRARSEETDRWSIGGRPWAACWQAH